MTAEPTRVQEVEAFATLLRSDATEWSTCFGMMAAEARTLAAEVDELRAQSNEDMEAYLEMSRIANGYCADIDSRDATITALLALLKPGEKPRPDRCNDRDWTEWSTQGRLYEQACKIAGRTE